MKLVDAVDNAPNYRAALEQHFYGGKRRRYRATFRQMGGIKEGDGEYVPWAVMLLTDVIDDATGATIADHIWVRPPARIKRGEKFGSLDVIAFDAKVLPYVKGRRYQQVRDYKLDALTRVRVVTRTVLPAVAVDRRSVADAAVV